MRGGTQDRTTLLPGVGNSLTKGRSARSCAIAGCGKLIRARNWCAMHYQRWWVHGDPLKASKSGMRSRGRKCSIEDCDRAHKGHGFCAMHMQRLRAHGSPLQSQRYEYFTTRGKARCHMVLDRDPDGLAYAQRGRGPAVSARARTRVSIGSGLPVRRAQAAASEKP